MTATAPAEGPTRTLARFVEGLRYTDLPDEVVRTLKCLTFNILGCAVRGYSLDSSRIVARVYEGMGGTPEATVLGTYVRLPVPAAAAVNAHSAYATMNDDSFFEGPSHPGHTVITAALATAEKERASGPAFLTACVAGFETGNRIIAALAQDPAVNYARFGWRINIVDTFCAGVPAGKLLGQDEERLTATLAIAAGSASGVIEGQLISLMWPWDGGRATYLGLVGAAMAQEGMTAGQTPLEGDYGFVRQYTGGHPPEAAFARLTRGLGREWETARMQIKRWCGHAREHTIVDAAQEATLRNGVAPEEIRRILIKRLQWPHFERLRNPAAKDAVRTRTFAISDYNSTVFNIPYAIAVAIVDGQPFSVADDMIAHLDDPVVRDLMSKVVYEPDRGKPEEYFAHNWPGWAIVETTGGRTFEVHVEHPKGKFPENPFTEDEVIAKFRRNVGSRIKPDRLERIVEMVRHLEKLEDMRELTELLRVGA